MWYISWRYFYGCALCSWSSSYNMQFLVSLPPFIKIITFSNSWFYDQIHYLVVVFTDRLIYKGGYWCIRYERSPLWELLKFELKSLFLQSYIRCLCTLNILLTTFIYDCLIIFKIIRFYPNYYILLNTVILAVINNHFSGINKKIIDFQI